MKKNEKKIDLTPKQLEALQRRIKVASEWQERVQMASLHLQEAREATDDLVAVLAYANGIEAFEENMRLEEGALILTEKKDG